MALPSSSTVNVGSDLESRRTFLLAMYRALWDNINRHILVVWQSITALFTALGASFLTDKKLLSPDLAFSLVVIAGVWSIAHALDSKGWFNRNLAIISNIEREFLHRDDHRLIHYFYTRPHHTNAIDHLRIQIVMAISVCGIVLAYHFTTRVWPGFVAASSSLEPSRALPYLVATLGAIALTLFNRKINARQKELDANSPGKRLDP
jgi:hypothetical protein